MEQKWTCCEKHVSEKAACGGEYDHLLPHDPSDHALRERWQFYETPVRNRPDHRLAVAIDCEMGSASDGESELIRLTVIDYFLGKTLIDTLVYPDTAMQHFNTRWSGVTRSQMEKARRQRTCLFGTAAARAAIFQYVGRGTFIVGHGMSHDLLSLRWRHNRIIDSFLMESNIRKAAQREVGGGGSNKRETEGSAPPQKTGQANDRKIVRKRHPDGKSLKALALKNLGRSIQVGKGHDSLEDAVAARDLVDFYIRGLCAPSGS